MYQMKKETLKELEDLLFDEIGRDHEELENALLRGDDNVAAGYVKDLKRLLLAKEDFFAWEGEQNAAQGRETENES